MADTGWLSPSTSATYGKTSWINTSYIYSSNDTYAYEASATQGTDAVKMGAYTFGVSVPAGSTIDGISVSVEAKIAFGGSSSLYVELGSSCNTVTTKISGSDTKQTGSLTTGDTYYSVGGSADGWNASLTKSIVEGSNFGVIIYDVNAQSSTIYVDHVQIRVYYTDNALTKSLSDSFTISDNLSYTERTVRANISDSLTINESLSCIGKAILPKVTTWYTEVNDPDGYGYESPDPDVSTEGLVTWNPKFSAEATTPDIKYYWIWVGTAPSGGSAAYNMWNYQGSFTDTLEAGEREKITYAGSVLQSDVTYYYQMGFKHINGSSYGTWTTPQSFKGIIPLQQWDADYHRRKLIRTTGTHSAYVSGQQLTLEFATGYGETVSDNAWINEAINTSGQQIVYHKGYTYGTYMHFNPDDASTYQQGYVWKRTPAGVITTYKIFDGEDNIDTHYYICIEVGQDEKLYICRGGHGGPSHLRSSTVAHSDVSGIDITSWGSWDTTTLESVYTTYPRIMRCDEGHLFIFFRITLDGELYYIGYITNKWNGSSYGGWGSVPRYVVRYDDEYMAHGSAYIGGCTAKGNRVYLVVSFYDSYGVSNLGRAVSIIYSDIETDNTNGFDNEPFSWKEYYNNVDGYREVARTSTSSTNTYLLKYGVNDSGVAPTKICTANNPTPSTGDLIGPLIHTNCEHLTIDNNGYPIFLFDLYPSDDYRYQECQAVYNRWDATNKVWLSQDLSGDSLFIATTSGTAGNSYTITITAGTVSGKKIVVYDGVSVTETFDNVDTPEILFRAINHGYAGINSGNPSALVDLKFVGSGLPDNCSATNLAEGSATGPVYAYKIFISTGAGFKVWNYRHGYHPVIDGSTIHCFALYKPSGKEQFGGELVQMTGLDCDGDNLPTWSYRVLTANSGNGIGMISTVRRVQSGAPVQLVYCRYNKIIYTEATIFPSLLSNGDDIRVIEYYYNGTTVTTTELDRLPLDVFQMEDTKIIFKLNTAISANKVTPDNRVLMLEYNNSEASDPAYDPDDIYDLYESFEDYATDSSLDGQGGWEITSGSTVSIYDTWQTIYYGSAATNKVAAGDKYAYLGGYNKVELDLGSDYQNKLVKIKVWDESGGGDYYLELYDHETRYIRVGTSSADTEQAQIYIKEGGAVTDREDIVQREVSDVLTNLEGETDEDGTTANVYFEQDVDSDQTALNSKYCIIDGASTDYRHISIISYSNWTFDMCTMSTAADAAVVQGTPYYIVESNKTIYDSEATWSDGNFTGGTWVIKFSSGVQSGNTFTIQQAHVSGSTKWIETTTAMDPMPETGSKYEIYNGSPTGWQNDYDIEAVKQYYHEYIILCTTTNGCYVWCDEQAVWDTANKVKQFSVLKLYSGSGFVIMDNLEIDTVPSTWTGNILPTAELIGEAITNEIIPTISDITITPVVSADSVVISWVNFDTLTINDSLSFSINLFYNFSDTIEINDIVSSFSVRIFLDVLLISDDLLIRKIVSVEDSLLLYDSFVFNFSQYFYELLEPKDSSIAFSTLNKTGDPLEINDYLKFSSTFNFSDELEIKADDLYQQNTFNLFDSLTINDIYKIEYTIQFEDTLEIGDDLSFLLAIKYEIEDEIEINDNLLFAKTIFIFDSLVINDSYLIKTNVLLEESLLLNDIFNFQSVYNFADIIEKNDALLFILTIYRIESDNLELNDSVILRHSISLFDELEINEDISFTGTIFWLVAEDEIEINDKFVCYAKNIFLDDLEIDDSLFFHKKIFLADQLLISDENTSQIFAEIEDYLEINEELNYYTKYNLSDAFELDDFINYTFPYNLFYDNIVALDNFVFLTEIIVPDTIIISDTYNLISTFRLFDTIVIEDNLLFSLGFYDVLVLNDYFNIQFKTTFSDELLINDNIKTGQSLSEIKEDELEISDNLVYQIKYNIEEFLEVNDNFSYLIANYKLIPENLIINDCLSYQTTAIFIDELEISDDLSTTSDLTKTEEDTLLIGDSLTYKVVIVITDTLILNDNFNFYCFIIFSDDLLISDDLSYDASTQELKNFSDILSISELILLNYHYYIIDSSVGTGETSSVGRDWRLFSGTRGRDWRVASGTGTTSTASIILNDDLSYDLSLIKILEDSLTINDNILLQHQYQITDELSINDNLSLFGENLEKDLSDYLTIEDTLITHFVFNLADNLVINDGLLFESSYLIYDSLTIEENLFTQFVFNIEDSLLINDLVSTSNLIYFLLSDDLDLQDTNLLQYSFNLEDNLIINDEPVNRIAKFLQEEDSLTVEDYLSEGLLTTYLLEEDLLLINDSLNYQSHFNIEDYLILNDDLVTGGEIHLIVEEILVINDGILTEYYCNVSDDLSIYDDFSNVLSLLKGFEESISFEEGLIVGKQIFVTESVLIYDVISSRFGFLTYNVSSIITFSDFIDKYFSRKRKTPKYKIKLIKPKNRELGKSYVVLFNIKEKYGKHRVRDNYRIKEDKFSTF